MKGYTKTLVGFERISPKPLEANTVFDTYEDALDYAQNNPTAYVGQIISAGENVYVIKKDKSIQGINFLDKIISDETNINERAKEYTYSNVHGITFTHGLGYNPEVIFLDENGVRMYPSINYPSTNTIEISWNGDRSGKFYLI